MRIKAFSVRVAKEILRDPLTLMFGIGFPVILLLLLSVIQANIPVALFEVGSLTPGISVFGLAFMTLFTGQIIAKDRESAFMLRLYTTPMKATDFLIGYVCPMLLISLLQCAVCYLVAFALGLPISLNVLMGIIGVLPIALFYVSLGLLCGSSMTTKQVGGICGALLTNVSAWLSGIWFDIKLIGGAFETLANLLPFIHSVEFVRAIVAGNSAGVFEHLLWVIGYTLLTILVSIFIFLKQMKKR